MICSTQKIGKNTHIICSLTLQPKLLGFVFFADNRSVPVIKQWDDLSDLRIGMLRGYKHFPKFDNDQQLSKIDFLEINTAVNMLLKKRIDVIIVPPSFDEKSLQKITTFVTNNLIFMPMKFSLILIYNIDLIL